MKPAKRCTYCKLTLPAGEFYERPSRAGGLSAYCQQCSRDYPDPPTRPGAKGAAPAGDPLMTYLLDRRRQAAARLGTETCPCVVCCKQLARLDFSKGQWRGRNAEPPTCLDCQAARRKERAAEKRAVLANQRYKALQARGVDTERRLTCHACGGGTQSIVAFSEGQWEKDKPTCRKCVGDYQRLRADIRAEEKRTADYNARR